MKRRYILIAAAGIAILGCLFFWARGPGATGRGGSTTKAKPPATAVFLIVVDTLRADRLSCYGYGAHRTVNIDRLADRGVTFDRLQSAASWTTPSMGAMLTSLFPTQLGLVEIPARPGETFEWRQKRGQRSHVLPARTRTLGMVLHDAGFYTGGFVNQPALNFATCYRLGFDDWYWPVGPNQIEKYDPTQRFTPQEWPSTRYADVSDWGLVGQFDGWLEQHGGEERLFAWIHLLTPHRPYEPAEKYAPAPVDGVTEKPTASQRYDGEVRAIDDMIGKIVGSIERHVGWDRSLIVFTSDHGEALGEHGMTEHGHSLHREVVHIPLIVVSPSLSAGERMDRLVSAVDLFPTILALTGESARAPSDIVGTSLIPLIDKDAHRMLYMEGMLYGSTERAIVDQGYKLLYDQQGDVCSLFDLTADPEETVDLATQQTQRAAMMCAKAQEIYGTLLEDHWKRRARAGQEGVESDEDRQRAMEALRSLGYVDD